jgi:hypothetical protein
VEPPTSRVSVRSPKIKMTMTNAKIGYYPIAPRGRVPFEYHGNANGPDGAILRFSTVRSCQACAHRLRVGSHPVPWVWLWAVGRRPF